MSSMIVANGTLGIGTDTPDSFYAIDINGNARIIGNLIIVDSTSAAGPMNIPSAGANLNYNNTGSATFTLQHNTSGGSSSILFKSTQNRNSDFGYIQFFDNLPYVNNIGGETCLLVIGVENDPAISYGTDRISLSSCAGNGNNGYIGINTIYPSYQLHVIGDAYKTGGTSGLWATGSDKRIKENIVDADLDLCYNNFKKLKLKYFKWKDFIEFENNQHVLGFIADEVLEIFPKSVKKITKEIFHIKNEKGQIETVEIPNLLTLNTDAIDKTMYGTIQKLINISETQEKIIQSQEKQLLMIESKYEFLEKIMAAL